MIAWVPDEFRQFGGTTTLRGIQRMLKAKNRVIFLVWLIAVVIYTCVLIWQLSVIFRRYASYPVSTLLTQFSFTASPPFPDITVCNANPLVHDKDLYPKFINYSKNIQSESFDQTAYEKGYSSFTMNVFLTFQKYLLTPPDRKSVV